MPTKSSSNKYNSIRSDKKPRYANKDFRHDFQIECLKLKTCCIISSYHPQTLPYSLITETSPNMDILVKCTQNYNCYYTKKTNYTCDLPKFPDVLQLIPETSSSITPSETVPFSPLPKSLNLFANDPKSS